MKTSSSLSSTNAATGQPALSSAPADTANALESATTTAGLARCAVAAANVAGANARPQAPLVRPGLVAPSMNSHLGAMREYAGRFVETLTRAPALAFTGEPGPATTRPLPSLANSGALMETIAQAGSMPDTARVTMLGLVAIALPQHCESPELFLVALEYLRGGIGSIESPALRYRAITQLAEQFSDPSFEKLAVTAGAESFFHGIKDDLDSASHVIARLPDAQAQAVRFGRVREQTLRLAAWSGLMSPINSKPVAETAPLLEHFSGLLTQLQSAEERSRGVDCLLNKIPYLPFHSQVTILENVTNAMRACVPPDQRLDTLDRIVYQVAEYPDGARSKILGQLAATLGSLPVNQRKFAFELLLGQADEMWPGFRPHYLHCMANAINSLPDKRVRQLGWLSVANAVDTLPQVARREPLICLFDNIGALAEAPTCINYLMDFVPNLVDMPPPVRHKALLHMINALQQLPAGKTRTDALEQTILLMNIADASPEHGVMQLAGLTGMLHYIESTQDCIQILEIVVFKARSLPDGARTAVLEAMTREFRGWQNRGLLKPAVMMISRECQSATADTRNRLASAVTAALSLVGRDLQAGIRGRNPDAWPIADIEAFFQAAAIAPDPGRAPVLQAADDLVMAGAQRGYCYGQGLLALHGRNLAATQNAALAMRLATAAR